MSEYQKYYGGQLDNSYEYTDWVTEKLRKATPCLIIGVYSSKKWQIEKGESSSGIEIKNDRKLAGDDDGKPTHNLYIEIAEKGDPSYKDYVSSGIYRDDHCYLYLIGNYDEVFLFSSKQLRRLYEHPDWYKFYDVKKRKNDTSIGFTMPRQKAIDCPYLLYHWVFDEDKVKEHHPGQRIM